MSTSISSLPNELSIEKNKEPVTLNVKETNEKIAPQNHSNTQNAELSKDSINKIRLQKKDSIKKLNKDTIEKNKDTILKNKDTILNRKKDSKIIILDSTAKN